MIVYNLLRSRLGLASRFPPVNWRYMTKLTFSRVHAFAEPLSTKGIDAWTHRKAGAE